MDHEEVRGAVAPRRPDARTSRENLAVGVGAFRDVAAQGRAVVAPSTAMAGSVAPLAGHPRVMRKQLPPETFSHIEDRDECLQLEYTPYFVEAPVDLRYPSRCTRMGRQVDVVFGVIVPASVTAEGLEHTLAAISANVRYMTNEGWEWQRVAVVIVVDGLHSMSASMAEYLRNSLHLYDPALHSSHVKGERVHLHVYERTLEIAKHLQAREYYDPLQVTLAISAHQCGDMKSYQWLFNSFCQQMQPQTVITLAAGVKPTPSCTLRCIDGLRTNPRAVLLLPNAHITSSSVFHPLIMSQLFLSKIYASLYTPFHALFGFVPGGTTVCSVVGLKHSAAIRWAGVNSHVLGKFFESQDVSIADMGPIAANRHLSPGSVFAWEVCRSGQCLGDATVVYDSAATVHVSVPQSFASFFEQQRMDHNGYFFNMLFYLATAPRAFLSPDPTIVTPAPRRCGSIIRLLRLPAFLFQYFHTLLTLVGHWFTIAALYLILQIVSEATLVESRFQLANGITYTFKFVFVLLVVGQGVAALGMDLTDLRLLYTCIAAAYGFMFSMIIIMAAWRCVNEPINPLLLYGMAICGGAHIIALAVHGTLYHAAKSFVQFVFSFPVYLIMIPLHAFATCNNVAAHRRCTHADVADVDAPVDVAAVMSSPTFANGRYPRAVEAVDKEVIELPWDPKHALNLVQVRPHTHAPGDKAKLAAARKRFASFRIRTLMFWLGCNWLAVSLIVSFNFVSYVPWGLVAYGAYVSSVLCVGSVLFAVLNWLGALARSCGRCCRKGNSAQATTPLGPAKPTPHPTIAPKRSLPRHDDAGDVAAGTPDGVGDYKSASYPSSREEPSLTRQSALSAVSTSPKEADMGIGGELREAEGAVGAIDAHTATSARVSVSVSVAKAAKSHVLPSPSNKRLPERTSNTPSPYTDDTATMSGRESASPLLPDAFPRKPSRHQMPEPRAQSHTLGRSSDVEPRGRMHTAASSGGRGRAHTRSPGPSGSGVSPLSPTHSHTSPRSRRTRRSSSPDRLSPAPYARSPPRVAPLTRESSARRGFGNSNTDGEWATESPAVRLTPGRSPRTDPLGFAPAFPHSHSRALPPSLMPTGDEEAALAFAANMAIDMHMDPLAHPLQQFLQASAGYAGGARPAPPAHVLPSPARPSPSPRERPPLQPRIPQHQSARTPRYGNEW